MLSAAVAGPSATTEALDRLEEVLLERIEEGRLSREDMVPAIVVSTKPIYEESNGGFQTRALDLLSQTLGDRGLRVCEACMAPRTYAEDGNLVLQTGPIGLDEVQRLDDQNRGDAQPARTAIWVEETKRGVSVRIVDIATARVVFAQNIDPNFIEYRRTQKRYRMAAELERRARQDSLTQAFVDVGLLPDQHVSLDWTDQWGKTNSNLTGITLTAWDPLVGLGVVHYKRLRLGGGRFNPLIGGKVVISLPSALSRVVDSGDFDLTDTLVNGVAVARIPLWRSNYGILATASTNGRVTIGVSLMNISLLPVIP
ncbi:MAG: hypothetical protein AAGA48_22305 [Myxococcota bacterium]